LPCAARTPPPPAQAQPFAMLLAPLITVLTESLTGSRNPADISTHDAKRHVTGWVQLMKADGFEGDAN